MLKLFIRRPVLSTVISVIIIVLGILGISSLPVAQYPDIAPPTIQVSASYPGANTTTLINSVVYPLEQQINGVEGMTYMTSSASNTGSASISVYFAVGVDPNQAAVDVQNRISTVLSKLPQAVTQAGVTVRKQQSSNVLIVGLYSDKKQYDQKFLQNYAAINIVPQLQRAKGVGGASVFGGAMTYAMRIWLQPDKMAAYGLVPSDVTAALNAQNFNAAPGKIGDNMAQAFQYDITYSGTLVSLDQFQKVIVKSIGNGQYLYLKDIARIDLGTQTYTSATAINGKPAVAIAISQTPGSNAQEVIVGAQKVMADASKILPSGIKMLELVNINNFLNESISKVLHTLVECFLLVFLVILIFLQDVRSTIIHGVSVPVSIIGTFFFLYLFGYSLNLLTLFALVLAIGIVVDDAVVVVEAVHSKLEQGYTSPRKAAIDAMGEIAPAIVSITLVMASVFLPVTFLGGSAGVFYKQFGITLAIAIMISAVNALTLSPALAAMFLRPHKQEEVGAKKGFLQKMKNGFNSNYEKVIKKYTEAVSFLIRRKWLTAIIVVAFGGLFYFTIKSVASSFVPAEDMGTVFVNVTLPAAATKERVQLINKQIDSIAHTIPQVQASMTTLGQNQLGGSGSSYGMLILRLTPWSDRPGITDKDIITQLTDKTKNIRGASINFMQQPTISGFGTSGGFTFQIEDRGGHSISDFYAVSQNFLAALNKRPEIQYAATAFNPNFPQYEVDINIAKCEDNGVQPSDILNLMNVYYGSSYVSNFTEFGQQYQVILQADNPYRGTVEQMNNIKIRTSSGTMSPISEYVTMKKVFGPSSISRFNMYNAISINGSPNTGYSTGQSMEAINEVAAQALPPGYSFEYSGMSKEEQNSGSQASIIFLLSLCFVYLLLSALYESYILPLAVILSLPVGLSGIFVFAKLFGIDNNIYVQICMIMLIGLLAKNAILMVEFSLEKRQEGMGLLESALEGAKIRIRPILMTSLAFIFGLMPLMFSTGVGANGNRSIGIGSIGGMLFGTLLGIFVIPGLYVIFQGLQEKIKSNKYDENDELIVENKK
ncbi:efflux RND transporter permease subunit [Chryseobacterium sp. ERMR1:04]|uniref:efflux RND transporter permease subunit n=1 Tax=Chryseobacterium sp. ERMR1:04 TaxID=1705393 RepID=UPI0006C8D264|nr:efflux RND transporter permease subunit [Chryseobacterium sp. ERMR1:04]KPH13220.1 multidrug transporter AcrB [Chryseobacterium sp. ERMR1:04]